MAKNFNFAFRLFSDKNKSFTYDATSKKFAYTAFDRSVADPYNYNI